MIGYVFDDGGRAAAGYKGTTGDCVCRAIAIATGRPYQEVYDLINNVAAELESKPSRREVRLGWPGRVHSSARTGVGKATIRELLGRLGWTWTPTMAIGTGCRVHLDARELPKGRLIVSVSKHLVAVIDGVVHDNHDPRREGSRCVYGYWRLA